MKKEIQVNKDQLLVVKYATMAQRLMAYNIDMMVLLVAVALVSLFVESNQILFVIALLITCMYHALMESSEYQATLGKMYGHLVVVDINGQQLTFARAFLRILMKFPSLLLAFGGFFMIYFRKDRRGLHDILVKTYVVCH